MMVAGLVQREQRAQTGARPKLPGPFAAALLLSADTLHCPTPNRPTPPRYFSLFILPGALGKIALFAGQ